MKDRVLVLTSAAVVALLSALAAVSFVQGRETPVTGGFEEQILVTELPEGASGDLGDVVEDVADGHSVSFIRNDRLGRNDDFLYLGPEPEAGGPFFDPGFTPSFAPTEIADPVDAGGVWRVAGVEDDVAAAIDALEDHGFGVSLFSDGRVGDAVVQLTSGYLLPGWLLVAVVLVFVGVFIASRDATDSRRLQQMGWS